MIWAGEHRWRAAMLLVEQDRLPTALQQGLSFVERDVDDGEAAIIACIENTARKDDSPWEDAKRLRVAADRLKLSAPELGKRTGRTKEGSRGGLRDIQSKLKVAREATAEAIAAYEADPKAAGAWERLRDSVSTPKTPTLGEQVAVLSAAVTTPRPAEPDDFAAQRRAEIRMHCDVLKPKHLLVLVETADRILRHPAPGSRADRHLTLCGESYPDSTGAVQTLLHTVGFGFQSGGGEPKTVSVSAASWDWLVDKGYLDIEEANPTQLGLLRQQALGIGAEARVRKSGLYWTDWLNLPISDADEKPVETDPDIPPFMPARDAAMPDYACDDPWIPMPKLHLNLDASRQVTVKLYASPDGLQHVATLDWRWAGSGGGENARIDSHNPACPSRFLALQQARARLVKKGAPDWALTWMDQQMGPHVANGVDDYNSARAGEARRDAGLEKRQANYGSPAPSASPAATLDESDPADQLTAQGALAKLRAEASTAHPLASAAPQYHPTNEALRLIAVERARQVEAEGYDPASDDGQNPDGQLAHAAAAYAAAAVGDPDAALFWPGEWDPYMFKPTGGIRDLIRAGALIVAEIERRQREAGAST
jgi:hypothetical protein